MRASATRRSCRLAPPNIRLIPPGGYGANKLQSGADSALPKGPGSKSGMCGMIFSCSKPGGRRARIPVSIWSSVAIRRLTAAVLEAALSCWDARCRSRAALSRSFAIRACSCARRSNSRRAAACWRSHSDRLALANPLSLPAAWAPLHFSPLRTSRLISTVRVRKSLEKTCLGEPLMRACIRSDTLASSWLCAEMEQRAAVPQLGGAGQAAGGPVSI